MIAAIVDSLWQGLGRLSGPVLEKELRVLSRQRRTYWVRSGYLMLLLVILLGQWLSMTVSHPFPSWNASVTSQLTRLAVNRIVWLQFVMGHVLAAVILGSGLTQEIRSRTLAVLLASPLRGIHWVWGKLISGLLLPWSLLLLNGPVLAMIRVWGGVTWDYLGFSALVMFFAVAWMGALSLFVSLWLRQTHHVVILVLQITIGTYAFSEMILRWGLQRGEFSDWWLVWCPYGMQKLLELNYLNPGLLTSLPWLRYCAILAGGTLIMIMATSPCLRHGSRGFIESRGAAPGRSRHHQQIKRQPVLWRELQGRSLLGSLTRQLPWLLLLTGAMVSLAGFSAGREARSNLSQIYGISLTSLWLLVALQTSLDAAICMTREKEAGCWPVLLTTPLSSVAILGQKAWAVAWKNLAGWLPLCLAPTCYLMVMSFRFNHDSGLMFRGLWVLIMTVLSAGWIIVVGNFWGLRLNSGLTAVLATLASVLIYYVVLEYLGRPLAEVLMGPRRAAAYGSRGFGILFSGVTGVMLGWLNLRRLRRYRCE